MPVESTAFYPAELIERRDRLVEVVRTYGRVAVALSGGVDSGVAAKAAYEANPQSATAFTAASPSLPEGELDAAREVARLIGIRHMVLSTAEFDDARYAANPTNRCYFCKSNLYETAMRHKEDLGFDVLVNGANLDDLRDHRPGMTAAREFGVRSPLIDARLTKSDVRELARHWELPNWNKPAGPCLSSRVAYGVPVTPERVKRIDAAERWLKARLGPVPLRVREEANLLARIELPLDLIARVAEPTFRIELTDEFRRLGFRYITIDLDGFRSGSLNASLPILDLPPM